MATPSINARPGDMNPGMLRRIFSATNIVLFLLCVMYGLTYIDRTNVSTAASLFKKDLHLTQTQVGLVFSAFAYPYLIFQIVGGWVSDRFGARRTLTVCAVIWAGATIYTGLAGSLLVMIIARVLLGLGEGATFPTATRAMSDWAPASQRGFVQGITHSAARLGNAITPPLVAWLALRTSWRGSFYILGVASLAFAVVWGMYFRDNPAEHRGITQRELKLLPDFSARKQKAKVPIPWGRLTVRMAPVTLVYFCYGWTLWLYLTWIPSFFLHSYKLDLKNSALFSSGVFFAGVIGDTLGGVVSDRIYKKTGDGNKARRNLVIIGFLFSLVFMVPVLLSHNLVIVAICLSMAFFFAEFTIGPMWAIPMDIAPRFSGTASGLMNVGSAAAAIISPVVGGYIIDKTGNWNLPFLGSIGLLLLGAVLAYWMKPNETLAGTELGATPGAATA
jgi:MFS family permease